MNLYVIRHIESRHNVKDKENHPYPKIKEPYEKLDATPTEKGLSQGERLGLHLSQIKLDAVLCGPLHCHVATAEKIVKYQDICRVEIFSDLGETTVPDYPGMPIEVLRELYPDIEIVPPADPSPTGGKLCYSEKELGDWTEQRKRAKRMVKYLLSRFGEEDNVAIVTSMHYLGRVLYPAIMKLPDSEIDKCVGFGCDFASLGCVDLKARGGSRCIFLNDTAHLYIPDEKDVKNLEFPIFPWE